MRQEELKEIKKQIWALLKPQIEAHLNEFQRGLVAWQQRVNAVWNTMNVVVRVLVEKGLVTEEDMKRVGADLMREAQMNVTNVQVAAAEGRRIQKDEIIASPLDKATEMLGRLAGKGGDDDKESQSN